MKKVMCNVLPSRRARLSVFLGCGLVYNELASVLLLLASSRQKNPSKKGKKELFSERNVIVSLAR